MKRKRRVNNSPNDIYHRFENRYSPPRKRRRVNDFSEDPTINNSKETKKFYFKEKISSNIHLPPSNQFHLPPPRNDFHYSKELSQKEKLDDPNDHDDSNGHYNYEIGEIINNRYEIISFLGDGTFSRVVQCFDHDRKRNIAIKIIRNIEKYTRSAEKEIIILNHIDRISQRENVKTYCIYLMEDFSYREHTCLVFPYYGLSIYDFIKENGFVGFPIPQIQHILKQMLYAIDFLHFHSIIHTDLKPENILFRNSSSYVESSSSSSNDEKSEQKKRRILYNSDIVLTDFGSAIFSYERHSRIVSTRHYRSPEVILELGWDYRTDLWSIGCILFELFTGDAMFQTHENREHLAIMEHYLGPIPKRFVQKEILDRGIRKGKYFDKKNLSYAWPLISRSESSVRYVSKLRSLESILFHHKDDYHKNDGRKGDRKVMELKDLILKFLRYSRYERITPREALNHPFFSKY